MTAAVFPSGGAVALSSLCSVTLPPPMWKLDKPVLMPPNCLPANELGR